ncbi:hypothetical protein [Gracilibacillus sp. YIM 98692]|uniref:hypothetical protein n=1 Tax=Gracilibacillus sp. YIM 98692 TaxID=2663532 RepID=UPI0013D3076C|nr:hypothetical protein [Gracilibacillus sp. YIM 98692]
MKMNGDFGHDLDKLEGETQTYHDPFAQNVVQYTEELYQNISEIFNIKTPEEAQARINHVKDDEREVIYVDGKKVAVITDEFFEQNGDYKHITMVNSIFD